MPSTLHVGAVIDSRMPCAWIAQLLRDVQAHEYLQLHTMLDESALERELPVSCGRSESMGQWLIKKIIDRPQFDHDPWAFESLPTELIVSNLVEQSAALSACDVILHLTPRALSSSFPGRYGKVWTAELPALDKRITHHLLTRAPFIWIHIWQLEQFPDSQTLTRRRIASHSLPCQTYSISDLHRLTYSALPSVFMSRLVWLANMPERKLDTMETQAIHQGVFEAEQRQAELDAMQMSSSVADNAFTHWRSQGSGNSSGGDNTDGSDKTNNRMEQQRSVTSLTAAVGLLVRQSYERFHHKLFTERWQLAILPAASIDNPPIHTSSQPSSYTPSHTSRHQLTRLADVVNTPVHEYKSLSSTTDVVWADPHLIEHNDTTYVFFEKMRKHNENAHIAYAALDNNGKIVSTGKALSADHHLSFPFVFTHEGEYYMIPETSSLQRISLYKAKRFPDAWEHHAILLSGINAADTVIFRHENRWWMFTNCQSHRSVDERDELHIYFANALHGPWQAHALNPVLTGVDRSRMAGAIIEEDGYLYRPSQYGAYRYGFGINLSRIELLTPSAYRESAVWRMLAHNGAGWSGCHSFATSGTFTMIDRVRFSRR